MSESRIIRIETQVHGRALVREATESASDAPLLVGFHGYGQNGEDFLEAVCKIPGTSEWHVASIQALHPFYDRKTGAVGASWMTSQDRDLAISDNVAYVTRAIDEIRKHLGLGVLTGPTVLLGFSQGTAMAYRTAWCSPYFSDLRCDGLIALAGDAPSAIDSESKAASKAESTRPLARVLIGRGTNDTWYDEQKLESDVDRLTKMGSTVETCIFEGGHEWTDEFRTAAGVFLETAKAAGE